MHLRRMTLFSLALCPLLALAACTRETPVAKAPGSVKLYGVDGNMKNLVGQPVGKAEPGLLSGMKGTAPLTQLSEAFTSRLRSQDPRLQDYAYAGEAYDAVVIMALATQLARTTEAKVVKNYVNGVTIGGTVCSEVAECLGLARKGTDLQYRGITVKSGFKDAGEPSTTSYATLVFSADSTINSQVTEFIGAGSDTAASTEEGPAPVKTSVPEKGAPLVIGGLLSLTGTNSASNPPKRAGAMLAIKDINAAGGVLGENVTFLDGDDGTDAVKAKASMVAQIAHGATMFLGPTTSGVSKVLIPQAAASKVILFSPSATSSSLTGLDDDGYFFRTAPSDELQARALADVIMRDGTRRISILYRNDAYGEGLQKGVSQELVRAGVEETDLQAVSYEIPANAADLQIPEQAGRIKEFHPEGVLVIGLAESAYAILGLATGGVDIDPRLS
jgi:ABC-type branched-subunit amino acid transport system substrate-binding protein